METRRNLVYELRDPEFREKYLHPRRRGFRDLFKNMAHPILSNSSVVFSYLLYGISMGITTISSAYIVEIIAKIIGSIINRSEVTDISASKHLFLVVFIYVLVYFISSSIGAYTKNKIFPYFFHLRNGEFLKVFQKFSSMEMGLFEDAQFISSIGNWGRALQSNANGFQGILERSLDILGHLFSALSIGVVLLFVDYRIIVVALIAIFLSMQLESRFTMYQRTKINEERAINRRLYRMSEISSDFKYGKDVRVYKMESAFGNIYNKLLSEYDDFLQSMRNKRFQLSIPVALASTITFIFGVYFLGNAYMIGSIPTPRFLMLMTALILFINSITSLASGLSFINAESIYLHDYYDLLDAELEPSGGGSFPNSISYDIEFENVWFKYPGSENWVLKNINFRIEDSMSMALVGINGAGKTSLIKLLTGLYQPNKGRILIGGVDIRYISQRDLSKIFGTVFQDINPMALTVAENVAVSVGNIDRERVRNVLIQVGLMEKIDSFPLGIDTPLLRVIEDDGIILSGGENQKLMIARALYKKDAKILIMDEPTAALDALAEESIYKSFHEILKGRTAIFISHRLASTRFCDKISLLDGGCISEEGTHEQLLENKSNYYEMYEVQASYYKGD
ncbi:MAG: ABC transporter ATP-binding protein [Tissierellia bacterium]|nr:ABC transporter ATP-binding protein [Tissierellia bacterium]